MARVLTFHRSDLFWEEIEEEDVFELGRRQQGIVFRSLPKVLGGGRGRPAELAFDEPEDYIVLREIGEEGGSRFEMQNLGPSPFARTISREQAVPFYREISPEGVEIIGPEYHPGEALTPLIVSPPESGLAVLEYRAAASVVGAARGFPIGGR